MAGKVVDVERLIDNKKIGVFHYQLVALCFLMLLIDGFDISVGSFAGPGLIRQFGISAERLGFFFSAGLIAGLVGTPFFGFLADRFGRKKIVTWGAIFFGVFTWAAVTATSFDAVIALRFIAGMGISGIMPITVALVSEFAPRRHRAGMVTLMFIGTTAGGGVTGLVATQFVGEFGWQILFWVAGVAPVVLGVVLMALLPESLHFLIRRNHPRDQVVRTLRWLEPSLQIDADDTFTVSAYAPAEVRTSALFAGRLAVLTPLIWVANICSMTVFFFANSWLPVLLGSSSLGPERAAMAATLYAFAGSIGGVLLAAPLDRFGFALIPLLFACGIPALFSVGIAGLPPEAVLTVVILTGFCLYGLQFGIIALEGPLFPPPVRGRGVSFCFAIARLGAAGGPWVAGVLIHRQVSIPTLFMLFTVPLAIGCIVTAIVTPLYRGQVLKAKGGEAGGEDGGEAVAGTVAAV